MADRPNSTIYVNPASDIKPELVSFLGDCKLVYIETLAIISQDDFLELIEDKVARAESHKCHVRLRSREET